MIKDLRPKKISDADQSILLNSNNLSRKNTKIDRIIGDLNPPGDVFSNNKYKLEKWLRIIDQYKNLIWHWTNFKQCRLEIEVFFNIAKNILGLNKIHQYALQCIEKKVVPIVFLATELISLANSLNIDVKTILYYSGNLEEGYIHYNQIKSASPFHSTGGVVGTNFISIFKHQPK